MKEWRIGLLVVLLTSNVCYSKLSNVINSFPVREGQTGPVMPGDQQYPFVCRTVEAGLGEPLIDNHKKLGVAVRDHYAQIKGYSKDCSVATKVEYFYKTPGGEFKLLNTSSGVYPDDLEWLGVDNPYIVRVERGVINRFLYTTLVLANPIAQDEHAALNWNGRLIYYFGGGVGIGYQQASKQSVQPIKDFTNLLKQVDFLEKKYAVVFSTGTTTSTHYNLKLGLQTAQMVKQQVITTIGEPEFTLGFGFSGGAIQGYVYAEQDPTLLDGLIAGYSYPDMLTQTIHVGDCELLEHYFDVKAQNSWDWDNRMLLEGMYSSSLMKSMVDYVNPHVKSKGSSSCVNGWRGTVPVVLNPYFGEVDKISEINLPEKVYWDFWNSANKKWQAGLFSENVLGVVENSFDNEGVQYGLRAFTQQKISKEDFFDVNRKVGGWKPVYNMSRERGFPFANKEQTTDFNPWSYHNAYQPTNGRVAKRSIASSKTLHDVKRSSQIFTGKVNLPVIDWRPYLDHVGDQHFAYGSFMARARIFRENANYDNQVIWITEKADDDKVNHLQLSQAIAVIDEWVTAKQHGRNKKPRNAIDSCFNAQGRVMYSGNGVWDGVIDGKPLGKCAKQHNLQIYNTSRIEAGADKYGDTFKCNLTSVVEFWEKGGYAGSTIVREDLDKLKEIFPTGVCDIH